LRVPVRENAGDVRIDANQVLADALRAINSPELLLEFVAGDCVVEFCQPFPVWWVSERMAEAIGGADGGKGEEQEKDEEEPRAKDHGLDFRLFNTMLARC